MLPRTPIRVVTVVRYVSSDISTAVDGAASPKNSGRRLRAAESVPVSIVKAGRGRLARLASHLSLIQPLPDWFPFTTYMGSRTAQSDRRIGPRIQRGRSQVPMTHDRLSKSIHAMLQMGEVRRGVGNDGGRIVVHVVRQLFADAVDAVEGVEDIWPIDLVS